MNQLAMRHHADNLRNRRIRDEHYDYKKAVKEDALDALYDYDEAQEIEDVDDLADFIQDNLFDADSVTGNGSGSYTFDSKKAKEYVLANFDLLRESADEFGSKDQYADWFFDENWEALDVSIRCYVLGNEAYDIAREFLKRKNK